MKQYFFSFLLALIPFVTLAEVTDSTLYREDSFLNFDYLTDKKTYYGAVQTNLGDGISRFISCKGAIFTEDVNNCELEGRIITIKNLSELVHFSWDNGGASFIASTSVYVGSFVVAMAIPNPISIIALSGITVGYWTNLIDFTLGTDGRRQKLITANENTETLSVGSSRLILFKTKARKNNFLKFLSRNQEYEYPEILSDDSL